MSAATAMLEGLMAIADKLQLAGTKEVLRRRLRRWIKRQGLPVKRIAGRYYADPADLEAWLASHAAKGAQNVP